MLSVYEQEFSAARQENVAKNVSHLWVKPISRRCTENIRREIKQEN
jgi:hypothetical protein